MLSMLSTSWALNAALRPLLATEDGSTKAWEKRLKGPRDENDSLNHDWDCRLYVQRMLHSVLDASRLLMTQQQSILDSKDWGPDRAPANNQRTTPTQLDLHFHKRTTST